MFERIILAVDGSESAARAIEITAELANHHDSRVVVIHAYGPIPRWLGSPDFQHTLDAMLTRSNELVDRAIADLRERGVGSIESDILEGPAAEAIVNAATSWKGSLIVMGSRGLTPMRGLLLGSVSERVLGRAKCPVLVTR